MRKKLIAFLATATLTLGFTAVGLSACSCNNGDEITFTVNGEEIAKEQTIELGELFMPPKVVAGKGGDKLNVSISVTDADGEAVRLINKKFKANDARGYTLTYTATDGEEKETFVVTLKVKDTTAPGFSIKGTSGSVALRGTEVEVPDCVVNDVSSDSLVATYTVKDPVGAVVPVTEGKFTASLAGDYVITYTATDASGNVGSKEFIVSSKNAVMLSDFEEVTDIGYCAFADHAKELTTENAVSGNAVKVTVNQDGPSWARICVPLQKANGEYYTWKELQEFEGIQISVWSSGANELDLAAQSGFYIESGKNTIYYSMSDIKANYAQTASQYEENGNGFFLNLRTPTTGLTLIFDQMIGIYADDYVPKTMNFDVLGADGLIVGVNKEVKLPVGTATHKETGETSTANVISVKDAAGASVPVTDGKFTPTALGEYFVTYAAADADGNVQNETITFVAKNLEMLNDFDAVESVGWVSFANEKTVNAQYAVSGGGVSVESTGADAVNWGRICVPFKKADGTYYTWEELQEFEGIQLFVYSNVGTELDLAKKTGYVVAPGYNVVYYSLIDIAASLEQAAAQYTADANGFYINLRSATEGSVFVFDKIVGVYADDYAPSIKFKGEDGNPVATEMSANLNEEVILPTVSAIRKGQSAATVSVKVYDAQNGEVTVTGGKFIASAGGGYTIVYTAEDGVGSDTLTIHVSVNTRVGEKLNDFKETGDVYWVAGSWWTKTAETDGIRLSASSKGSWSSIYLTLTKDGQALTWEQVQAFEEIQIVVYASYAGQIGLNNDVAEDFKSFNEGRNVLTFTKEQIQASYDKNSNQYNASGFSLNLKAIAAGQSITFASITGYYPEA